MRVSWPVIPSYATFNIFGKSFPKKNEEVVEINKPISNGKETLILNETEEEEIPLILDQEHKTEKIKKTEIKTA